MTAPRRSPSLSMSAIRSNIAAVDVQNRVSQAASSLPAIVNQGGVTIKKQNPNFVLIVNLTSPDGSVDLGDAVSNYAYLQIVDPLKRLPGVGDVQIFGERRYSMRVWLDPDKLANLGITAVDVQNAIAEQNVQVAAGKIGQSPAPPGTPFEMQVNAAGPAQRPGAIRRTSSCAPTPPAAPSCACATSRASSSARCNIRRPPISARTRRSCSAIFQMPGSNALDLRAAGSRTKMDELCEAFPARASPTRCTTTRRASCRPPCTTWSSRSSRRCCSSCSSCSSSCRAGATTIIPTIAIPVSLIATLAVMQVARLLAQHAEPARHGAGDRPGRRRRDRRRRERRAPARGRAAAARRRAQDGDGGSDGADHRHDRGADGGVRAGRLHSRRRRAGSTTSSR